MFHVYSEGIDRDNRGCNPRRQPYQQPSTKWMNTMLIRRCSHLDTVACDDLLDDRPRND